MATIQARKSRGYKYWYIVESRRINGKPRPIVLSYLGKADDLLKRLQGMSKKIKLKSYSHGAMAALLKLTQELDIPAEINRHIHSPRSYMAEKPIRNKLTAGMTLVLGAIGRICMPTSKRGWWSWAKTTSCEYLLRANLSHIDSQHFWDMMDALPEPAIEKIENILVQRVFQKFNLGRDTLFFDTTNFYTYIHTTNTRCQIAQRGKNKQRRNDLRQVGLAMVVTPEDLIPLFHLSYQGNMNDTRVFKQIIGRIKQRLVDLKCDVSRHTLVFDRGNNSKVNLKLVEDCGLYYVGALTPYHHKKLIAEAPGEMETVNVNGTDMMVYRDKREIWKKERTVLVFVSDQLKAGQIRGIYHNLQQREDKFMALCSSLKNPRAKKRKREDLEIIIHDFLKGQFMEGLFSWDLKETEPGRFALSYEIDRKRLAQLEDQLGFRILMTNRHQWDTHRIIQAYHGQSHIEKAFKDVKNPFHLAIRPQYHWTDQKIRVHFFICVMGYLLAALIRKEAKRKIGYKGNLNTLLGILNHVRLGTILESSGKPGQMKATYKLEEMSEEEYSLMQALGLLDYHEKKPKIRGVGVYI